MSNVTKYPTIITPMAGARWAWLHKKDTKFDEKGIYKITAVIDTNDDKPSGKIPGQAKGEYATPKEFVAAVRKMAKEAKVKKDPFKKDQEDDSLLLINSKSGYKPKCVDSTGKELGAGETIMSGDTVKVAMRPVARTVNGTNYLTFYLVKVVLYKKGDDLDFGDEEGEFNARGIPAEESESLDFGGDDDDGNGDF